MAVSTHVLDAARGRPAAGVPVTLSVRDDGGWRVVTRAVTDADGRVARLAEHLDAVDHRLELDVAAYDADGFYPEIVIVFRVSDPGAHLHLPVVLSPYSYTTYRGD